MQNCVCYRSCEVAAPLDGWVPETISGSPSNARQTKHTEKLPEGGLHEEGNVSAYSIRASYKYMSVQMFCVRF